MYRAHFTRLTLLCSLVLGGAASLANAGELKDLYFGEALYQADQGNYFEALNRLDSELAQYRGVDEPQLDTLRFHIDQAVFSVGDFELHYRMHQRAGRAISAVLNGDVEQSVRNDAAYRLARLLFQKGQPDEALRSLERIDGEVPDTIRDDVELLRANIYMALDRPADAAGILRGMQGSEASRGFATYNLGIAQLRTDRAKDGVKQLDRAGQLKAQDEAELAIRDKANLVLGTLLFDTESYAWSKRALDRVRLDGPFSNQALLKAGWADMASERFERALVPWSILARRDSTDAAVQEALLALPYAYSKLHIHGRAAVLYDEAVKTYGQELEKLDASIASIRDGRFLEALVREEIRHDRDWVVRLRSLSDAPETFYLVSLMSSHEFQSGLQNYLDLEDLRKRLAKWKQSLAAFDDVIRLRREYYEPRLPAIDAHFRALDAQMRLRLEQREQLERKLQHLLVAPQPELLVTAEEQRMGERLDEIEERLANVTGPTAARSMERINRLKGVLSWRSETLYHSRLTEAHRHLTELNAETAVLQRRYEAFVRARQAASHGYEGYGAQIARLRSSIREDERRIDYLMTQQGQALETASIRELLARRQYLEKYLNQARFAFADSYDRAAKSQAQ